MLMGRIYAKCVSRTLGLFLSTTMAPVTFVPLPLSLAHAVQLLLTVRRKWLSEKKTFSRTNRLEHRGGTEPTGRGRGLSAGFAHRGVFFVV